MSVLKTMHVSVVNNCNLRINDEFIIDLTVHSFNVERKIA